MQSSGGPIQIYLISEGETYESEDQNQEIKKPEKTPQNTDKLVPLMGLPSEPLNSPSALMQRDLTTPARPFNSMNMLSTPNLITNYSPIVPASMNQFLSTSPFTRLDSENAFRKPYSEAFPSFFSPPPPSSFTSVTPQSALGHSSGLVKLEPVRATADVNEFFARPVVPSVTNSQNEIAKSQRVDSLTTPSQTKNSEINSFYGNGFVNSPDNLLA